MDFQFANKSELDYGVTIHELCAAEGLAIYTKANCHKESMTCLEFTGYLIKTLLLYLCFQGMNIYLSLSEKIGLFKLNQEEKHSIIMQQLRK